MNMQASRNVFEAVAALEVLRPLDVELGYCMAEMAGEHAVLVALATAAASLAVSQGHSCLPLDQVGAVLAESLPAHASLPALPDAATWHQVLSGCPWVSQSTGEAAADPAAPLVLDAQGRLYLGRYFHYERQVAQALRQRLTSSAPVEAGTQHELFGSAGLPPQAKAWRQALAKFFTLGVEQPDWQAVAALTGLASPLAVITGGPGTGKTTTVLWMLAAMLSDARAQGQPLPRIRLAAPTGKAAVRLSESLRARVAGLTLDPAVREALPVSASTLHRLLGVRRGSTRFRHHAGYPLDADVMVVDEVSMVDLPLMAKLLDALPDGARLVLLGDRDQLASVEAGNVLAAICAAAGEGDVSPARAALLREVTGATVAADTKASDFADAVVELRHSHRFNAEGGLGRLAAMIRAGDADACLHALAHEPLAGVAVDRAAAIHPAQALVRDHTAFFAALGRMHDPAQALQQALQLRVLTALRGGPSGASTLNAAFEHALRREAGVAASEPWYAGRLLLVTENDYGTELFNGDIGIVLPDDGGHLLAWFPDDAGGVRSLPLQALPAHESAYAMTIHKSQGSEFDEAVIVLPTEDARVLGRELLYTAVTRARERVRLIATDSSLRRAIERSTRRFSGLADALLG